MEILNTLFKEGRYLLKEPEEGEDSDTMKELKKYYKSLLHERGEDIRRLKDDHEDLLHLVDCLEKQKTELLKRLKSQNSFSL